MSDPVLNSRRIEQLRYEHRQWLKRFDPQHARNWELMLRDDVDAALTEAAIRDVLETYGATVEPNEDLVSSQKRPDFRCEISEYRFLVEVTSISIAKVNELTGLDHVEIETVTTYQPLTRAIWNKCIRKAAQCDDVQHPTLLAIGTFHWRVRYLL